MEGAAVAAYGAETAVEGAVGAGVAIARSTMPLKATWKRIQTDVNHSVSSHSLSIVKGKAYVFGGESGPGATVPNQMHVFTLSHSNYEAVDYQVISAVNGPSPRTGHTATVVDDRIYILGGRGGDDHQVLEERGQVFVYDTKRSEWTTLHPAQDSPIPPGRCYHASAASDHPMGAYDQTEDPLGVSGSGFDDHGTIFIHGGLSAKGPLADVFAFDIAARVWTQLSDAPGPPRSGPSVAFTQDRLYRFGGINDKELGGSLDYLHFTVATFDDKGGKGELAVTPRTGRWESISIEESDVPSNRSAAGLQAVTTGQGRNYLLLFLGETEPSPDSQRGPGKLTNDAWSFQLKPDGNTAASWKDATRLLVGANTAEGSWARVDIAESSKTQGIVEQPSPRGWFGSSQGQDLDPASIILWGGLLDDGSSAGDGWILTLDI